MLIAIHKSSAYADSYPDGWAACLAAHGIGVRQVDLAVPGAFERIGDCDGVMWHWNQSSRDAQIVPILRVIELQLGIAVFPDFRSSWHRRDKLAQFHLLQAAGIPMPATWVFRDKQEALAWARQASYPKVVKLSSGGGGNDVALIRSAGEAVRHIDRMFGAGISKGMLEQRVNFVRGGKAALARLFRGSLPRAQRREQGYAYFQEYIAANEQTFGISVIGDRAFGALSLHRASDFQTDGDELVYDPSKINIDCVRLAFDACRRLELPMMAFDMLLRDNAPVVLEMNFRNGTTLGFWNRDLEWTDASLTPQEAQVETFLDSLRRKHVDVSSRSASR